MNEENPSTDATFDRLLDELHGIQCVQSGTPPHWNGRPGCVPDWTHWNHWPYATPS